MKIKFTALFLLLFLGISNIFSQSLTLMTYNIRLNTESDGVNRWDNRKDFLTGQISFYEPDILGIQESMPGQVADMDSLLPAYIHIGTAREGEGKGESSSIFFKSDRFTIFAESTFWLSETPDKVSKGWDAAYNRVCTYGLFYDKQNKNFFWVFNTHLDHIGEIARTKSIELILKKINTVNTNNYPVFLMGDFNSTPDSDRILSLKKTMHDTREISKNKPFGPEGTFTGFRYDEPVKELIDYIFISKDDIYNVSKYAILTDSKEFRYPSDHFPVYVKLSFKK